MNTWPPPPKKDPDAVPTTEDERTGWHGFLHWLFTAPQGVRTAWSVIEWWEMRRFPYNLIVGGFGFCCLMLIFFFASAPGVLAPGEDVIEPISLLLIPIAMNICYTAGWIVELLRRFISSGETGNTGPFLLKVGLAFSLLVPTLLTVLAGINGARHLFRAH